MKGWKTTRASVRLLGALTLLTAAAGLHAPAAVAIADSTDMQVDAVTADTLAGAAEQSLEHRVTAIVGTATATRSPASLVDGKVAVDAGHIAQE